MTESPQRVDQELDDIGRVATAMVDGDVCQRIVTARALSFMFKTNPNDRFLAGDNYDVSDVEFNTTKKTLIRLARLAPFPCDVNLWMPIEGHPGKIMAVIRNINQLSQFWTFGDLDREMIPQMQTVLDSGQRVTVKNKPGWTSLLAPVYNSLGDIVGLVEAVTYAPTET
ncbi:MAG: hypothetical protein ACRD2B_08200 [Terriglobia bacterium]